MSDNTAKRREELYVVEIDGVKNSEHRTFIEALKCGMELKRCYPRSDVKLHDAHENAPHEAHHPVSKRTWENGRWTSRRTRRKCFLPHKPCECEQEINEHMRF